MRSHTNTQVMTTEKTYYFWLFSHKILYLIVITLDKQKNEFFNKTQTVIVGISFGMAEFEFINVFVSNVSSEKVKCNKNRCYLKTKVVLDFESSFHRGWWIDLVHSIYPSATKIYTKKFIFNTKLFIMKRCRYKSSQIKHFWITYRAQPVCRNEWCAKPCRSLALAIDEKFVHLHSKNKSDINTIEY